MKKHKSNRVRQVLVVSGIFVLCALGYNIGNPWECLRQRTVQSARRSSQGGLLEGRLQLGDLPPASSRQGGLLLQDATDEPSRCLELRSKSERIQQADLFSHCSVLYYGETCYSNPDVWAMFQGYTVFKLLQRKILVDSYGKNVSCVNNFRLDQEPPVLTVHQEHCYPIEYWKDNPDAEWMKGGWNLIMREGTSDSGVVGQFFCEEHFFWTQMLAPYLKIKGRDVTVIDAGANIGMASILLAQVINFKGEVFAVEANPETLEALKENVKPLGDKVKPVSAALVSAAASRSNATVRFAADWGHVRNQAWGFRIIPDDQQSKPDLVEYQVPTISLGEIKGMSANGHIDLLKIDIEGEEQFIFEDKESWPILCELRCFAAEIHNLGGAGLALMRFLKEACCDDPFQYITKTGEYLLWCRPSVLSEGL